jgi:hypothetical protein
VEVDDDRAGSELDAVVKQVRANGYLVGGDALKTQPRGYPADHPRIDLLRHRALVAWIQFGAPAWLHTAEAAEQVARSWRDMSPLSHWLDEHVGPTREPRR